MKDLFIVGVFKDGELIYPLGLPQKQHIEVMNMIVGMLASIIGGVLPSGCYLAFDFASTHKIS